MMVFLFCIIGVGIILFGIFTKQTFYMGLGFIYTFCILLLGASLLNDDNVRNKRQKQTRKMGKS